MADMRAPGLAALLVCLAGCGVDEESATDPQASRDEELVECSVGGAGEFKRECVLEARVEGATSILIVRHPDGSFRRFDVLPDGSGLTASDGADMVHHRSGESSPGYVEIEVGGDRYRLPATAQHARS